MDLRFHTDNAALKATVTSFLEQWNTDRPYFEVKTSGSTGKPKTIRIQKKHAKASARMTGAYLGLSSGQNALLCLSPDTIAGKMMIIRAIEWDLTLHVVTPSSNPFEKIMTPIDFVAMVPYQMAQTIQMSPDAFHKDQKIIIGGGPVNAELTAQIQELSSQCFHTFGMTETITHIALKDLSNGKKSFELLGGVTANQIEGRLQISAPHLGVENLSTNDCVTFLNDREFIWQGRLDFVVNSGGVKIHPEEVEFKLSKLWSAPFFVIGVPDQQLGEKLVLCIESVPFPIEKSAIQELLPKFHVPKKVYFFERFEYTKSDKINRLATIANTKRDEAPLL